MIDLRNLGTPERPLRASLLNSLVRCPGFAVLKMSEDDVGGKAADTGSALGFAVERWHLGDDEDAAKAAVRRDAPTRFPAADLDQSDKWFDKYAADPRNPQDAVLIDSLEREVSYSIEADPSDPTGAPIFVTGHLDQVRRGSDGVLEVWDLKTGGLCDGPEMIHEYCWQQSLYALAAEQSYREPVRWGGVIRVRGYDQRQRVPGRDGKQKLIKRAPGTEPVFFNAAWSREACLAAAAQVARIVAQLRRGTVPLRPGKHCLWCPSKGFQNCTREFQC